MKAEILNARENLDSVGGIIECAVIGMPKGTGNPMFDGIENRIASMIFGIGGIKGIEFGSGFNSAEMYGSQSNDDFYLDKNGNIYQETNNSGGILGGISTGMPIVFSVAVKPTPCQSRADMTLASFRVPCLASRPQLQ